MNPFLKGCRKEVEELEWYVLLYPMSTRSYYDAKAEKFNLFCHMRFVADIKKALKRSKSYDEFRDEVRKCAMYYFWSKCEYEIVIYPWPRHDTDKGEKIDVFKQLEPNLDAFCWYIITSCTSNACKRLRRTAEREEGLSSRCHCDNDIEPWTGVRLSLD